MNGSSVDHHNKKVFVFAIVFIVATIAFFWQLGKAPIGNSDEGIHALVTRQMREDGNWLTMRFQDELYFRKPPLSFWIRAVTQNVFGENEFTDRLPSALAGVGTTMLVAFWAWRWTKRTSVTLIAGMIYPLLPSTFIHTFRTGEADGLLIFLTTLSALLFWLSLKKPWYLVGAALTTALAFMTKSVAAGVVPIAFLLTLLVLRKWPYRWKHVVVSVVVFLAVALPWHIYELAKYGKSFWDEYVGFHIIQRVETKLHVTPQQHDMWWYLRDVSQAMFPWSFLIIPASAFALFRLRRRDEQDPAPATFLLLWGFGTVVLFSLAATKLAWYVAPAFPAFVLLVARFIVDPLSRLPRWLQGLTAISAIGYFYDSFHQYRTGISRIMTLAFLNPNVALALVVAVALAILFFAYRRSRSIGDRTLNLMTTTLFVLIALMSVVVYSRYIRKDAESPLRVFRNEIVTRDSKADVYIFDNGIYPSPLTSIYLVGQHRERAVVALKENEASLQEIISVKTGAFVVFERQRGFAGDTADRLEHIKDSASLSLYRIR
ncbi:MAG: glycosyltransferase family 39 protein [Candidatus Kerfeldbacteria bacterium]